MEAYPSMFRSSSPYNFSSSVMNMMDDNNGFLGMRMASTMEVPQGSDLKSESNTTYTTTTTTTTTTTVATDNGIVDCTEKSRNKKGEKKVKKARFAFQTRSQVDILDDGYRWRKYGQKAVKNNRFPRSYYRCIHEGCKVKKQVQRLSKDEGVVVTTYEGVHSHPIQKSTDNFENILMTQMQIYATAAF